ncbi:MAG: hypothetical protein ACI4I6_01665 [Hominimerdicola sp.]
MEDNQNEMRQLLEKLIPKIAVLTVISWCITLFWGFDVRNLIGLIVGLIYVCFCYVYLAKTCVKAVELDFAAAKKAMFRCYIIRFFGLFALCAVTALTGFASAPCVLLPQFFPKIVLTIMQFTRQKG